MLESRDMPSTAHLVEPSVELPRPLKAAELSSQQRNALVDSLVAVANNHAKVLAEMRTQIESIAGPNGIEGAHRSLENHARINAALVKQLRDMNEAWQQMQLQQNARLDAHANILLRLRLMDRLRWLVLGR